MSEEVISLDIEQIMQMLDILNHYQKKVEYYLFMVQ